MTRPPLKNDGEGEEQFSEGPGGRRQAEDDSQQQEQAQQGAASDEESSGQANQNDRDEKSEGEEGRLTEVEEQEQRDGEESEEAEKALVERSAEAIASEERAMRLQQWLNQLVDDPSLLLKRKFQHQYSRRQNRSGGAAAEDSKW